MKTTDKYVLFYTEVFSQWHPSNFEVGGKKFCTAEQFMMYFKALTFGDQEIADKILATNSPREQKKLGRAVKGFDAVKWNAIAKEVVFKGNRAKFQQNPEMFEQLMATGHKELVEASPYDTIWGIGFDENAPEALDKSTWNGTNWLGEVLTKLRDVLRREQTIQNIVKHGEAELEKFARDYPNDIGRLYESYKKLKTQSWSEDFLRGYLGAITDLIIIKKGHWGDSFVK